MGRESVLRKRILGFMFREQSISKKEMPLGGICILSKTGAKQCFSLGIVVMCKQGTYGLRRWLFCLRGLRCGSPDQHRRQEVAGESCRPGERMESLRALQR